MYVVIARAFDLKTYLSYVINFNITGPYYYFVFFFQLLAVAPILLNWCRFCHMKKYAVLLDFATVMILCIIAAICINYTHILSVHGGGQLSLAEHT